MCFGKCDNQEGNLCNKCEKELADVRQQSVYDDGWWPAHVVGQRSINIASSTNDQPKEIMYV